MDTEQPPRKRTRTSTRTSTTSMTGNRVAGISKPLGTAQASAIRVTQAVAATTQSTAMVTQKSKATNSVKSGGKTVTTRKRS